MLDLLLRDWTQEQGRSNVRRTIQEPESIDGFFLQSLRHAPAYRLDDPPHTIKLDQNETALDWPAEVKETLSQRLRQIPWNRYPDPFARELTEAIAQRIQVPSSNLMCGPGTNYLISLVLSCLTRIPRQVVIAQPSFPLYEMHCRYEGIPYELWPLDENFEYRLDLLPKLKDGSLIVFASPNNPCGNALKKADLITLLEQNPKSLILADEAYFEYNAPSEEYLDLLSRFDNIILLRTFSKTLAAAGIRIGYLVAAQSYVEQFHKLRLPFLINTFSIEAARIFLQDSICEGFIANLVSHVRSERDRMSQQLRNLEYCFVPSYANFFMLRLGSNEKAEHLNQAFLSQGILARTIYRSPRLEGCIRVSIGTEAENSKVLEVLQQERTRLSQI